VSERRHRTDEDAGDRKKRVAIWLAWGVVVALLGANLLSFKVFDKGFMSPDLLWTATVWGATAATVILAMFGVVWIRKAYSESERSSHLWMRRSFVFSIVGAALIVHACYDSEIFTRNWMAALAAGLFAVNTLFVAMAAHREYRRVHTGRGRRPSPAKPSAAPSLDDDASSPAETPRAQR